MSGSATGALLAQPKTVRPEIVPSDRTIRGLEGGVFLIIAALPLVVAPFTSSPSFDPKLPLLALAALIFGIRGEVFRSRLSVPVCVWFVVAAVASLVSVDPGQSLLGAQGNGLVLVFASGMVLLAGTGIPDRVRDRVPGWLVAAGIGVAAIGISARLWPGWVTAVFGRPLGAHGSGLPPLGHAVFFGAFLSAAMAATVPLARRRPLAAAGAVAVLAAGIMFTGKRGPLLAAGLGLTASILRSGLGRRRVAMLCVAGAGVVGMITVVDVVRRPPVPVTAARRFDEVLGGSAAARVPVWSSAVRAWSRRPVLGWGPGQTASATMSSTTESEMRGAARVWQDAHNIFVESLVTTGVLGLAALLAVLYPAVRRLRRAPRGTGWATGAVVALGIHHLLQPVNVAITPLLFLLLGLGGSDPGHDSRARSRLRRVAIALTVAAIALSGLRFGAAALEAHGHRYFSASHWALRASLRLEPGRISATRLLAIQLAIDAKGDRAAEGRVRAFTRRMIRSHPWDVTVRPTAAQAETLMENPPGAAALLDEHLRRFPHDFVAMAARAFAARQMGDEALALSWIRRSLSISPAGPAVRLLRPDSGPPRR